MQNDQLYMESHHSLEEHDSAYETSLPGMVHNISTVTQNQPTLVDWQLVSYLSKNRDGIPHQIGVRITDQ